MFKFLGFLLDQEKVELHRDTERVALPPRAFKLLVHLVHNRHRVVPAAELKALLWSSHRVGNSSLKEALNIVRRAVGDDCQRQAIIATVRGFGYRFVADVDSPAATRVDRSAPTARATASPLIGRALELQQLRGLLSTLEQGCGGTLLLEGEPGIGKTALARQLLRDARAAGVATASACCEVDGQAPPYWPWVQLMRKLVVSCGASDVRERIESCVSRLERSWNGGFAARPPRARASRAQFLLTDEIVDVLSRVASKQPCLLFLDELRGADAESISCLRFVARHLEDRGVVVLGAYRGCYVPRDHPLRAMLAEPRVHTNLEVLRLGGLDSDATAALADDRSASRSISDGLRRRTGGNPFLLLELLRHATATLGGDWITRSDAREALSGLALPATVRDFVACCTAQMPQPLKQAVDVVGASEEPRDAAAFTSVRHDAEASATLEALCIAGLLAPSADGSYRYRYPVFWESLRLLGPSRRHDARTQVTSLRAS